MNKFRLILLLLIFTTGCSPSNVSLVLKDALKNLPGGGTNGDNSGNNQNNALESQIIATLSGHCFLREDGKNFCWGKEFKSNSATDISQGIGFSSAESYLDGKGVKKIVSSSYTSCVIATDDKVYCWGSYSLDGILLGDGSKKTSHIPSAVYFGGVLTGLTAKDISMDEDTACIIASNDKVYCWGSGSAGQLGNGTFADSDVPVAVNMSTGALAGRTAKKNYVASNAVCIIADDNLAYCWGSNTYSQLGTGVAGDSNQPAAVDTTGVLTGLTFKELVMGYYIICTIASDDNAYCWGRGEFGSLGNGVDSDSLVPVAVDKTGVLSGKTIKKFAKLSKNSTICVIANDDNGYCWGSGSNRLLGNGSTSDALSPVAISRAGVLSGKTLKEISMNGTNACAIASDDKAYCWGGAYLGNSSTSYSTVPVAVTTSGVLSGINITGISGSTTNTCVSGSDGKIYCWDSSSVGVPYLKAGIPNTDFAASVLLGYNGTIYSVTNTGQLYAAGWGTAGQVGNGHGVTTSHFSTPYVHSSSNELLNDLTHFSVFNSNQLCSTRNNGDVFCGFSASSYLYSNLSLPALSFKKFLTVGGAFTCDLLSNNEIMCVGSGTNGQMGNGVKVSSNFPQKVTDTGVLSGITISEVKTSFGTACALSSVGELFCWGKGTTGVLGNGTSVDSAVPVAVTMTGVLNGLTIKNFEMGSEHVCVIASDNLPYCWGNGLNGRLGNNSTSTSNVPVAVTMSGVLNGKTVKALKAGNTHTCAVANDDKVYCWGDGGSGQLGVAMASSNNPVAVDDSGALNGLTIKSLLIPSTGSYTCVIASDDKVYCWGAGTSGQLGNGSSVNSSVPVVVSTAGVMNGKNIKLLSLTIQNACAVDTLDEVYCWGRGTEGQLGNGSNISISNVPVKVTF